MSIEHLPNPLQMPFRSERHRPGWDDLSYQLNNIERMLVSTLSEEK